MKIVLVLIAALVVFAAVSVASERRKLRQSAVSLGLDAVEYRLTKSAYYDDFRIFAKKVKALVEEYVE
jgi:hypothetical protein